MLRSLLLLLLLAGAIPAFAQFPAEVRGRVTDAATGAPLVGARIAEVGGAVATRSAVDGEFLLRGLLPGTRQISVAGLGYREQQFTVQVANGRTTWLNTALESAAVALEGIDVVAERATEGTRIGRAEIAASGARELGELLRDQAGVTVTRRGGPGSPSEVSIRGASARETLVLLDGVPLNDPLTGAADLSTVPLEAVERVTLLRGAQSARYGGRALAGVIAIETRRPAAPELTARIGAGSWGERLGALSAGGRVPVGEARVSGLATAEWRVAEGDFPYAVPRERGGGETERVNGGASILNLLATAGVEHGSSEMRARLEALELQRGMPGSVVAPTPSARQRQERIGGGVTASGLFAGTQWRLDVDAQRQRAIYADPAPPGILPYDDSVRVAAAGGAATAEHRWGSLGLAGGGELRRLEFTTSLLGSQAPPHQTIAGAWSGVRWSAPAGGDRLLEIDGAVRVDHSSLLEETVLSPRAGMSFGTSRAVARVSAGNAFAPPSLADQFFQEGLRTRPNPDLRPERVWGEVQASVALRAQPLGPATLDAELTAYRADVDGMIVWTPNFQNVWQPRNIDVHRSGWEASTRLHLPGDFGARAAVSHTATEYANGAASGQVIYRPRWTASGGVSGQWSAFSADLSARYIGERRTVAGYGTSNLLPAFTLLDLRLGRTLLLRRWRGEATLGVENLLDRPAAMLVDYPFPGRTWSIGLRVQHQSP